MTIPELLDLLAKRAQETRWGIRTMWGFQWLRTVNGLCPIEFLAEGQATYLPDCREALALSQADARRLFAAADGMPDHDPALRRQLVQAVGVEETPHA